jgi:glutathione synthase/RimK-type ligase-like ATP-grasp enzyme
MIRHPYIILVDKPTKVIPPHPDIQIVTAADYIANNANEFAANEKRKVVNLCNKYDYLSKGYYCSLLAEARGHKSLPAARDIINLHWKRLYQENLPELNALLEKTFKESLGQEVAKTHLIYFGRTETLKLQPLARRIFDLFRFPVIGLQLRYTSKWTIAAVEAWSLDDVPEEKHEKFNDALTRFTGAAWSRSSAPAKERCWLAVLHDPQEKMPPSNKAALRKFVSVGRRMNCFVDPITKSDLPILLEYDALFIRETTSIEHHTFRFAHKAEKEGIPVMDDTLSIIRCCNKVFLNELLVSHRIPVPRSIVLERRRDRSEEIPLEFPFIVKIPDGSFSRGVHKIESMDAYAQIAKSLFSKSDIILAQEFIASDYDWRIGVLGGEPLFASQYYMADGHWQIYRHTGNKVRSGKHKTLPLNKVPAGVLKTACQAAKLIGNGLYGVDLKVTDRGIYVIEVNDNPNLDCGVEDQVLGDKLYQRVLAHFIDMIES